MAVTAPPDPAGDFLARGHVPHPVLGGLLVGVRAAGVVSIAFADGPGETQEAGFPGQVSPQAERWLAACTEQLEGYLAGRRTVFDLPLVPEGTPFQQKVWAALQQIPYGKTVSYRDVARAIGRPTAFRAVAGACGKNPLVICVPCHRVVAADGGLGGFSGGLWRKKALLGLEGVSPVLF
jgi:methylated-DNA-[protein]-cysteine S-methyltransferase